MITTKILKTAVGVQRGDVIDKTESTKFQNVTNGIIIGRFKRGVMGTPFKVNEGNFSAILGRDVANPSFLAIEDALNSGLSEVWVMRVGSSYKRADLSSLTDCLDKTIKDSDMSVGDDGYIPDYQQGQNEQQELIYGVCSGGRGENRRA